MKRTWMIRIGLVAALALGILAQQVSADSGELALGISPGTLGIGADATVGITKGVNARFGVNALRFDLETRPSAVGYELDVRLLSFPVLLDWYPFQNRGFRVSSGLVFNKNKAAMDAAPQSSYTIGGTDYAADDVGRLSGKLAYKTLAPYLGIGWGNALGKNRRWTFSCDLGVVFQGDVDVSLKASGALASDPGFRSDLEAERRKLENRLDDYRYYPVMSVGISYKF